MVAGGSTCRGNRLGCITATQNPTLERTHKTTQKPPQKQTVQTQPTSPKLILHFAQPVFPLLHAICAPFPRDQRAPESMLHYGGLYIKWYFAALVFKLSL